MSGAEGVINIDIGQSGEGLREGCVVLFFFFVKAKILEQDQLSGTKLANRVMDARTQCVARHAHRSAE